MEKIPLNKDLYYRPENNGKNFGLIEDEMVGGYVDIDSIPDISPDFNGMKDWLKYPSEREIQRSNYVDYMDCTVEAAMNAYHIFMELYNGWPIPIDKPVFPSKNLSQRFTAKMSGVTQNGNTTFNADNSVENDGVLDEAIWPRNENLDWVQYYSSIPQSVKDKAVRSLKSWRYKAYSISPDHNTMIKALKKGILGVTVYAWAQNKDGLYDDFGYGANHRCLVAGGETGIRWIARDSYPTDFQIDPNKPDQEYMKDLDWDYHFGEVKLITLNLVDQETSKKKIFLNLLKKSMDSFYYYWDVTHKTHNFFYIGVPSGETKKYRQQIIWDDMDTPTRFTFLALRKAMNQSSWPEISQYPDISDIGKKFA